jgi:brefeldin A-inhibited guanine nucleotide-exchange protein
VSFLEIISILTQRPPEILSDEEDFLLFLKNSVLPNVIENTTSSEPRIMQISLAIFLNLIKNYRHHLKDEIALFLDDVIIKMVDSVNNKAETKVYLIKVPFTSSVPGQHRPKRQDAHGVVPQLRLRCQRKRNHREDYHVPM